MAKTIYLYYLLKVTKDNLDAVLQQQIMDQFRKDNEALLGHLEQRKMKSLEDTKVIKVLIRNCLIIDLKNWNLLTLPYLTPLSVIFSSPFMT